MITTILMKLLKVMMKIRPTVKIATMTVMMTGLRQKFMTVELYLKVMSPPFTTSMELN